MEREAVVAGFGIQFPLAGEADLAKTAEGIDARNLEASAAFLLAAQFAESFDMFEAEFVSRLEIL